jgi:hypothetical protein
MKAFSTVFVFVSTFVVATVNANWCASTKWKIYLAGSTFGHQFVLAVPDNSGSKVNFSAGMCLKVELSAEAGVNNRSMGQIGGVNSHHIRRSSTCVGNNTFKFTICAPESQFVVAKNAAVCRHPFGEQKEYNLFTNNCQHYAANVIKELSKFKIKALRA